MEYDAHHWKSYKYLFSKLYEHRFLSYLKHMILPTIFASITSLSLLYLIFKKQLSKPMEEYKADPIIPNRFLTAIGLIHLLLATGLLAVASYIGLEMWIITISFATSLIIIVLLYLCIKKKKSHDSTSNIT